jgi:hypothetical protein
MGLFGATNGGHDRRHVASNLHKFIDVDGAGRLPHCCCSSRQFRVEGMAEADRRFREGRRSSLKTLKGDGPGARREAHAESDLNADGSSLPKKPEDAEKASIILVSYCSKDSLSYSCGLWSDKVRTMQECW